MHSQEDVKAPFPLTHDTVWLVTGAAGFIGSHLVEHLLCTGYAVRGLDNFSTGSRRNLEDVRATVGSDAWSRFTFVEGDITDSNVCHDACAGVALVLHQAALGSVPRSIADPLRTHQNNATGQLNMLIAARDTGVQRFIYAASSSTYGDHPGLPKVESVIGQPLSPYAVTKYVNELYAGVFARHYGMDVVGLRYFNVFGPRQDPAGAYAAVIPRWIESAVRGERAVINGDGETTRDFTFVENVIRANQLVAGAPGADVGGQVFNVAAGAQTSLNTLSQMIREGVAERLGRPTGPGIDAPTYVDFRQGDVRHSQADISKARNGFGYVPSVDVAEGLRRTIDWYLAHPEYLPE